MAPIQHLGNIDKRKRASQQVAFGFFSFLSYLVVVILFVILGFIILKGASVISWDFLTQAPQEGMTSGGIFPAIVGTLYLVIGSSLISFPIGIMSGIYMNEYATNGKLIRFIRIMTNNLSGVPSVVFGLFGMSPISGITSAVVLGIGRAIGETMAVLMVTGNAAVIPTSFFEPVRTIPATIAAELGEAPAGGAHYQALFMLGVVLFLITLGLSIAVEYISSKRKI